MAGSLTVKRSFTIPEDLLVEAQERTGPGGLSAYMARALETQLRIDRLSEYVAAADAQNGPVTTEMMAQVCADIADADALR